MTQQEAIVEQLISVIQVIQRNRMSGTLTVKRGNGAAYEEGVITFVNGHPVEAKVGRRKGLDVFNWISTWGTCSYQFIAPGEGTQPLPPLALATGTDFADVSPHPDQLPTERQTDPSERQTGPFARIRSYFVKQEADYDLLSGPITQKLVVVPGMPYRTKEAEEALRIMESKGLSRIHRHLFLLVNGQRPASELARMLNRPESVIHDLLQDLEQVALIKLPAPSTV